MSERSFQFAVVALLAGILVVLALGLLRSGPAAPAGSGSVASPRFGAATDAAVEYFAAGASGDAARLTAVVEVGSPAAGAVSAMDGRSRYTLGSTRLAGEITKDGPNTLLNLVVCQYFGTASGEERTWTFTLHQRPDGDYRVYSVSQLGDGTTPC